MIFFSLWHKIKRITVAIRQKTIAWMEPSGPNCPSVNHCAPSILEAINVFEIELPETFDPKIADWVKFQEK